MKILINTSTLYFGSSVQVALSFINELITLNINEYHVFLSLKIELQLDKKLFGNNFNFYIIDKSPSKLLTIMQKNKSNFFVDGYNGFICESNNLENLVDKIIEAIEKKDKLYKMGLNVIKTLNEFINPEKEIQANIDVIEFVSGK